MGSLKIEDVNHAEVGSIAQTVGLQNRISEFKSRLSCHTCSVLVYNDYMSEIAKTPYDGYKVYRVHDKKQNRYVAVLVSPNHRTTIAYAKYVLETYLGRKLKEGYQTHHKNEDKTDDDISNLEEMEFLSHHRHHERKWKYVVLDCPVCGVEFMCEYRNTHWGMNRGGEHTVCSIDCRGGLKNVGNPQVIKRTVFLSTEEKPVERKRAVAQLVAAESS